MKFGFDRRFWRRRSLKMVDDGPRLYYKLTNEPKGSGELIKNKILKTKPLQNIDSVSTHE